MEPDRESERPEAPGDASEPPAWGDASGSVCPVVALGASAGGLEALKHLFSVLPAHPGMAFVVIQHLDPERPSLLSEVLANSTDLPVVEATGGMALERDRVHVIPPGAILGVESGRLTLRPRKDDGHLHLPIDAFFTSLADERGVGAIGVVLSGSGADGTLGLRAIRAAGGITMAQSPESAQFRSMPDSALESGEIDFCGTPQEIAREIVGLSRHPYVARPPRPSPEMSAPEAGEAETNQTDPQENVLAAILSTLQKHSGIDFSGYKPGTVSRRIERRMALRRFESQAAYLESLVGDPAEAQALAQDMLINVTSFFRDPGAFEAVKEQAFRELVRSRDPGEDLRMWVPGCATGEEVYALVICLLEAMELEGRDLGVKVFGTDLSEPAIDAARLAVYKDPAVAHVSPERLARWFERVEGGYRIGRRVRDLCVFVQHDLTRDPPFGKLDLVSCRNLLIYFDAELQRRIVPMLHYCLNPGGYLFLGQSESITGFRDLFAPVDKDHRLFRKTGDSFRVVYPHAIGRETSTKSAEHRPPQRRGRAREAQRQADHLLLTRYAPPGVIVNSRLEVIQFRGRTGGFLEPAPGQPQANLLRMARGSLAAHLHDIADELENADGTTIRKEGLRVDTSSGSRLVDLEFVPLSVTSDPGGERYYLILFKDPDDVVRERAATASRTPRAPDSSDEAALDMERMRAELVATRDYLQTLFSEHQATTDELATANEELVASNEELQSTNEELQSAKEELQSTNEELSTVNDQLRHRNDELDEIANDLVNVLSSVDIPVILVDRELRVRRFTPTVRRIANLIPEDMGRPIDDLKLKVDIKDLGDRIRGVLSSRVPGDWEVQGYDGNWFRLQVRPYQTTDGRMDGGAVLSFLDVDALRRAIADAEAARDYARSIVETVAAALVVLDSSLGVVSVNQAFRDTFGSLPRDPRGGSVSDLPGGFWSEPEVRRAIGLALDEHEGFSALEVTEDGASPTARTFSVSGSPILWGPGENMVLLTVEDVTELRQYESERSRLLASEMQARVGAEKATRAKDLFLATLSHELRTPLSTILLSAQILERAASDNDQIVRASGAIMRAANAQARLIDDLLDVSRIVAGKLKLDLAAVDFAAVVKGAVDVASPSAEAKGLSMALQVKAATTTVYGDEARLLQVVNNLLTNAIKFTPPGGSIRLELEALEDAICLTVQDTGIGIREDVLPQLFLRFVQADSSVTRNYGGLGLGLSIVRHIVVVHGGTVEVESEGEGRGATFRVKLPLGTSAAMLPSSGATTTADADVDGMRVLLVEDDDDTRFATEAMLMHLGASVVAVGTAAEGLVELDRFRPDVILCDIAMPGEDGLSFMRKVRRLPKSKGGATPAAAVTAMASEDDVHQAINAGFQLHVGKPVDAARLAAVVSRLAAHEGAESFRG